MYIKEKENENEKKKKSNIFTYNVGCIIYDHI